MTGTCKTHGQARWVLVPCKRRACAVCGPISRAKIAARIRLGLSQPTPAAWLVLTTTIPQAQARCILTRRLASLWRHLKARCPGAAYAATYEQTRSGLLHINLLVTPWVYTPQATLQAWWGNRVWVEQVKGAATAAGEAAGARSHSRLASYLAKLEQQVTTGRRVSFSKAWPKKVIPATTTQAPVTWRIPDPLTARIFVHERQLGWWRELPNNHWYIPDEGPPCSCFDPIPKADGPPPNSSPGG